MTLREQASTLLGATTLDDLEDRIEVAINENALISASLVDPKLPPEVAQSLLASYRGLLVQLALLQLRERAAPVLIKAGDLEVDLRVILQARLANDAVQTIDLSVALVGWLPESMRKRVLAFDLDEILKRHHQSREVSQRALEEARRKAVTHEHRTAIVEGEGWNRVEKCACGASRRIEASASGFPCWIPWREGESSTE